MTRGHIFVEPQTASGLLAIATVHLVHGGNRAALSVPSIIRYASSAVGAEGSSSTLVSVTDRSRRGREHRGNQRAEVTL